MTLLELTGPEARPFLDDLAELRIHVFRDYPYLYDGDDAYEARYLATYFAAPGSYLALLRDGDRAVGASTALPLEQGSEDVIRSFRDAGWDPGPVYYFGESVLLPSYRGRGWGRRFFELREARAQEGGFELAAFCAVVRPPDHPRRPAGYRPLDGFWRRLGYRPAGFGTTFSWCDLDEARESAKPMTFWFKRLGEL